MSNFLKVRVKKHPHRDTTNNVRKYRNLAENFDWKARRKSKNKVKPKRLIHGKLVPYSDALLDFDRSSVYYTLCRNYETNPEDCQLFGEDWTKNLIHHTLRQYSFKNRTDILEIIYDCHQLNYTFPLEKIQIAIFGQVFAPSVFEFDNFLVTMWRLFEETTQIYQEKLRQHHINMLLYGLFECFYDKIPPFFFQLQYKDFMNNGVVTYYNKGKKIETLIRIEIMMIVGHFFQNFGKKGGWSFELYKPDHLEFLFKEFNILLGCERTALNRSFKFYREQIYNKSGMQKSIDFPQFYHFLIGYAYREGMYGLPKERRLKVVLSNDKEENYLTKHPVEDFLENKNYNRFHMDYMKMVPAAIARLPDFRKIRESLFLAYLNSSKRVKAKGNSSKSWKFLKEPTTDEREEWKEELKEELKEHAHEIIYAETERNPMRLYDKKDIFGSTYHLSKEYQIDNSFRREVWAKRKRHNEKLKFYAEFEEEERLKGRPLSEPLSKPPSQSLCDPLSEREINEIGQLDLLPEDQSLEYIRGDKNQTEGSGVLSNHEYQNLEESSEYESLASEPSNQEPISITNRSIIEELADPPKNESNYFTKSPELYSSTYDHYRKSPLSEYRPNIFEKLLPLNEFGKTVQQFTGHSMYDFYDFRYENQSAVMTVGDLSSRRHDDLSKYQTCFANHLINSIVEEGFPNENMKRLTLSSCEENSTDQNRFLAQKEREKVKLELFDIENPKKSEDPGLTRTGNSNFGVDKNKPQKFNKQGKKAKSAKPEKVFADNYTIEHFFKVKACK